MSFHFAASTGELRSDKKSFSRDVRTPIFTLCTYIEAIPIVENIFSNTAFDPGIRYEVLYVLSIRFLSTNKEFLAKIPPHPHCKKFNFLLHLPLRSVSHILGILTSCCWDSQLIESSCQFSSQDCQRSSVCRNNRHPCFQVCVLLATVSNHSVRLHSSGLKQVKI